MENYEVPVLRTNASALVVSSYFISTVYFYIAVICLTKFIYTHNAYNTLYVHQTQRGNMTKITIELTNDEDKQLRHLVIEKNVPSKAIYIKNVIKEHLKDKENI